MNIGIDISQAVYPGTGVSRFTNGLIDAILAYGKDHTWTFFLYALRQHIDNEKEQSIRNSGSRLVKLPLSPRMLSFATNHLRSLSKPFFHYISNKYNLDWMITSDWTEPPYPCKKATIVHDLVFRRFPETVHPIILKSQEQRLALVVKESQIIFTDSQSTADDLKHYYPVDENRIKVNYPGLSPIPALEHAQLPRSLESIPQQYILTVGKWEPRKNISRLVEAYQEWKKKTPTAPALVIVGPDGWGDVPVPEDPNIHIVSYVSDEDLGILYRNALFFMYPSLYEGFGYPVLEAMSAGCPVGTSNTSSLAEIGKDFAVLFDPHSKEDLISTMQRLFQESSLRISLSQKGQKHAGTFTWKKYMETVLEALT